MSESHDDDLDYEQLDPGIREVVRLLRAYGYDTTDSGDGVSKHLLDPEVIPYPHVFVQLERSGMVGEVDQIRSLLEWRGIAFEPVGEDPWRPHLQLTWDPVSEVAVLEVGGVVDDMLRGES